MIRIAQRYGGIPWKKIWYAPENQDLKDRRKNPNILFPGDVLHVPELQTKDASCPTEKLHRFEMCVNARYLRLVMQDPQGKPLAHKRYILQVDGRLVSAADGSETDDRGVIEYRIPPDADKARLLIDGDLWVLGLSCLNPIDTVEGLQQRLNNLNYVAGPVDGVLGPWTREALNNFQRDQGLAIDGIYGPKSRAELQRVHGC